MPKYEPHIAEAYATPRQRAAMELKSIAQTQLAAHGKRVLSSWTPYIGWTKGSISLVKYVACYLVPNADMEQWKYRKVASRVREVIQVNVNHRTVLQVETTVKDAAMIDTFQRGKWEQTLRALVADDNGEGDAQADGGEQKHSVADDDFGDPTGERERLAAAATAVAGATPATMNEPGPHDLKPEATNV